MLAAAHRQRLAAAASVLILSLATLASRADETTPKPDEQPYEPPLPPALATGQQQIKIVSEVFSDKSGYERHEEYLDIGYGRAATVTANKDGYKVTYVDADAGLCYKYEPYKCQVGPTETITDADATWTVKLQWNKLHKKGQLRLHGAVGYWLHAGLSAHQFKSENELVYSASQKVYRTVSTWLVKDEAAKLTTVLYFSALDKSDQIVDSSGAQMGQYALEAIQVFKFGEKDPIKTINILSIEYEISQSDFDTYLTIPVGFGCTSERSQAMEPHVYVYENAWLASSARMDLEVTAVDYSSEKGSQPVAEMVRVELAHAGLNQRGLQLVRRRNTDSDLKLVSNHYYNVAHLIDMRRGTCKLDHIESESNGQASIKAVVEFKNKLWLDLYHTALVSVGDPSEFKLTRANPKTGQLFFEATIRGLQKAELNRVIRTYATSEDGDETARLQSITVWQLNEEQTKILASYQINIFDSQIFADDSAWVLQRTFDISEECYINNERAKAGRDYAWVEFTYPAISRDLTELANDENRLKQTVVDQLSKHFVDASRLARVEIDFGDEAFVVRLLLLDAPPIIYMYNMAKGVAMKVEKRLGDESLVAPDLEHCASLCRMSFCAVMSYCQRISTCLIATREPPSDTSPANANKKFENSLEQVQLSPDSACNTYVLPKLDLSHVFNVKHVHFHSLQNLIARLKTSSDFEISSVPKEPDELALPRSETGISDEEYRAALEEYLAKLTKFFDTDNSRLFEFAIIMQIGGRLGVLLPNKFEAEHDPLRDFDLIDSDEDDDKSSDDLPKTSAATFQHGLPLSKYKALAHQHGVSEASKGLAPGEQSVELRQLNGLSYDQCATVCLDSRCGTFSYCNSRSECILSNINNVGKAQTLNLVESDPDCFIAQRDFLSNFVKFPNKVRQQVYERVTENVRDVSECALECVAETGFKCMSFDACRASGSGGDGGSAENSITCVFMSSRSNEERRLVRPVNEDLDSTCDHYARSILADFTQIEYHRIVESQLREKLKTSVLQGHNVFKCAESCASGSIECTAFQFCYNPLAEGPKQECTLIEGRIKSAADGDKDKDGADDGFEAIVDEKKGGKVVKVGKFLEFDSTCQVFALRRDTSEAHLRDLAFGSMTTVKEHDAAEEKKRKSGAGISFASAFWLFVLMTIVAVVVSCAVRSLKDNSEFVRQRIERARIALRI